MTEPVAASDIQQPGTAPAAPVAGRPPIDAPPIRAVWHINTAQGIQVSESLIPKGEDGKALPAPPDPLLARRLDTYRKFGVPEDVIRQVAERHEVSETEYRLAQHKSAALKSDPAYVKRFLDGGVEERRTMMTLSIILGSKIKQEEPNG
jgi:hypothetical protein